MCFLFGGVRSGVRLIKIALLSKIKRNFVFEETSDLAKQNEHVQAVLMNNKIQVK